MSKFVTKQAKDLQSVQQNGLNLQFIQNPSKEVCLAAVQQDGMALKYVPNPSPEVCREAVKQNLQAFQFLADPVPVFDTLSADARAEVALNVKHMGKNATPESYKALCNAIVSDSDPNVRAGLVYYAFTDSLGFAREFPDIVKKLERDPSPVVHKKIDSYMHNLPQMPQTEMERAERNNRLFRKGMSFGL